MKIKALVQAKRYPIQITSASTSGSTVYFTLNNINWYCLNDRIEQEYPISRSALFLIFPPAGDDTTAYYRKYEIKYGCNTDIYIPSLPDLKTRNVENYFETPITGTINRTSDADVGFPLDTFKAVDDCTNPSNISGTMWITCKVPPYVSRGPEFWGQKYAEFLLNPIWKKPTIFSIAISNTDIRNNIEVTWTANIQDFAEVEIWQNDLLKRVIPVGTERRAIIPGGTVGTGNFTIKVVAANNPYEDLGTTNSASASFVGTSISPTVNTLEIDQTEPRLPIKFSWVATNQTDYRAEIVQGGVLKANLTGGAVASANIPPNILTDGEFTINLYVNNTVNGISTTAQLSKIFVAKIGRPLITSLEPDKINNNVNLPILCTWNALNQETYTLKLKQNNIVLKSYSGTTAQELNIPADTFKLGECTLELTASNTINGTIATSKRESSFLGYGRPSIPIFSEQTVFNKALPLFKWTADAQISYKFSIFKGSQIIEESGEVISIVSEYQSKIALENNSEYTIKVQTKNQFGLWSYVAEKNITVSYTQLTKPEFDLIPDSEGGILINLDIKEEGGFSGAEIWRKEEYESSFKRLAINLGFKGQWTDYTIAADRMYYYKVVSKTLDGGRTESDIKSAKANIRNFHFVNIEDTSRKLILKRNAKVSATNIKDVALFMFAGRQAPVIQKGETDYNSFEMSFELDNEELALLEHIDNKANVILYRDGRGRKAYGLITSNIGKSPVPSNLKRTIVNLTFTETSFVEEDIYSAAGGLKLRKFDGTWKFDGSVKFNGIAGWDYGL